MRNFQDTFETRKQSFTSAFSVYMTVPLGNYQNHNQEINVGDLKVISFHKATV